MKTTGHYRGMLNLITLLTIIDVLAFSVMSGVFLFAPRAGFDISPSFAGALAVILILSFRITLVLFYRRKLRADNTYLPLPFK